jgi:hypothetical protein
MINSRHILNLSIELIIKAQALDRTSCYKCNGTKREADRAGVGRPQFMFLKKIVFKKVLKSFRRVLKSKNSLKS